MTASPPSRPRPLPWRVGDLLGVYLALAAGLLLILVAWWGASGTPKQSSQIAWANVGVAGIIVAGSGNVVWLLTGRRAVGERRARLLPTLHRAVEAQPVATGHGRLVAGPRMTRYHRPGCLLVAGKPVQEASLAAHRRAGRQPCGACRP